MRNFHISHMYYDKPTAMKECHNHRDYELTYILNGSRRFFIRNTVFVAEERSFALMDKNVLHKTDYVNDNPYERFSLYFTDDYFTEAFGEETAKDFVSVFETPLVTLPPGSVAYMEGLLTKIENEYRIKRKYYDIVLKAYVAELMVCLLRLKKGGTKNEIDIYSGGELISRRVSEYVLDNYMFNISLNDLAKRFNMSPNWFSTRFKKVTGMGFHEYLVRVRIQFACEALEKTNKSITDIAYECGFGESGYFSRVFKQLVGKTPRQYRQEEKV